MNDGQVILFPAPDNEPDITADIDSVFQFQLSAAYKQHRGSLSEATPIFLVDWQS